MSENSEVPQFEKEYSDYIGVKYAVAVGNGTDALTIALKAAGVGEGDEVITGAMSFFATAEAIAVVGAIPVFVDCTSDTHTIDYTKIEEKITKKTKVIIPVHLYGQCAEMEEINKIAKEHNLIVIEDMAQASGAKYKGKKAGSLGDIGCTSFFPTKNLGCAGDGGMIVTNNRDYYMRAKAFRVHGSGVAGKYTYLRMQGSDIGQANVEEADFEGKQPKYYNYVIGHNSRLDEIQAAILRKKLPCLDQWNNRRKVIADEYTQGIVNNKVKLPQCRDYNKHIYYTYVIESENREELREYLDIKGIGTGIYFPVPLHLQKVFENLRYKKGDMPNAERLAEKSLAIPMFPELTEKEISYIIDVINKY